MTKTPNLLGTTWSVNASTNGQGTFKFKEAGTASYIMSGEQSKDLYWWQNDSSFWMQEKNSPGWLCLIEGDLTTSNAGSGNIIAAEQANGVIAVLEFSMTKNTVE